MASEATKMAVIDNMHIHVRVFEVTEFNYEVRSDLRGYIIVSPLVFRAIALLFLNERITVLRLLPLLAECKKSTLTKKVPGI